MGIKYSVLIVKNMSAKIILIALSVIVNVQSELKVLKQVVILSRHNVRTPLASNLALITPKTWPQWSEKPGYLTQKGAFLEGLMGKYFSAWLQELNLITECPDKKDVYIYANVKQRTKASAKAFVNSAFPGCNVTVHHNDSEKMDPIFNPVIHNATKGFKKIAIEQMEERLESLKLKLNISFETISQILDYKKSEICTKERKCNLITDENIIINVVLGMKPNIKGPLKISNSAIDAFTMSYYQGIKHYAWDLLKSENDWNDIMSISRGYHNVIFNTTVIAEDISHPLLKYMSDIFFSNDYAPKMLLLMGHDANIYTILKAMDFKPYYLKNQYEIIPVGGKIVFQRWQDVSLQKDLLKIEYVYQSNVQLREGRDLTMKSPPQYTIMELDGCKISKEGFCLWDDFVTLLEKKLALSSPSFVPEA